MLNEKYELFLHRETFRKTHNIKPIAEVGLLEAAYFCVRKDYKVMYIFQKSVGKIHRLACTAVIFGHFDKRASAFLCQSVHITGIGTAEFIDVLVIVSHCYHTHLLIISY